MSATPSESSIPGGNGSAKNSERLDAHDAATLLELMADLACQRDDPRRWRHDMLARLLRLLPAAAAAVCILRVGAALEVVQVVGVFDSGFKMPAHHQAFLDEINDAPFQDPFSKRCLRALFADGVSTFTAARRKLVNDSDWYQSAIVERYRQPANIDNCLMSMQRAGEIGPGSREAEVMVLCMFRQWGNPMPFTPRERIVLDTLHRGLGWMYRAEANHGRLTRATSLTPRLHQALDCLLAGYTERQVAATMRISIHTVHDYVKALYLHFGVSSRGELLARWNQSGDAAPALPKETE